MARKTKVAVEAVVVETSVVEEVVEVVETTEAEVVVEETSLLASLMTPVETAEVVVEVKPAAVVKNQGVGKFVKELITDGLNNTEILKRVHEEYGNKNTTYACVAWYRNKMKKSAQLASTAKAVDVVEKFMADEVVEEVTTTVDLNDEEPEGESLMAGELRQLVGQ